ncbi:MAG: ATP-binding protein [Victivallales bacterium]
METSITCILALLEMTFIFVGLLILHGLRKEIGSSAFYITIGLLLVFTQLVSATELQVVIGFTGANFYIAPSVLLLPYLAALMIVYITEGTLATQRLIIGAMATLGFYVYLSYITGMQCGWAGYTISQGASADSFEYLLRNSQRTMASSIIAQTLDLFLIPIFFQRLRNLGCRMFFSVLGSLMLTQIADTLVYSLVCFWGERQLWVYLSSSYIAKAVFTIWLSGIASVYLTKIEAELPAHHGRRTLDIIFSFLGSYGKAEALERNLQESEGRYRTVIENASDMILLLNRDGQILDANNAALDIFKIKSKKDIIGKSFPGMLTDLPDFPFNMDSYWEDTLRKTHQGEPRIHNVKLHALSLAGRKIELDIALNIIEVENVKVLIIFGRNVTEQNRLNREQEELKEELAHAQRLESVGQLAGGVAHDFNNYLHAIQGNLDILHFMHDIEDKKVIKHLDRINDITGQAAKLTQELLGFARKGKYHEEILDLGRLMRETLELFSPQSLETTELKSDIAKMKMPVKGDAVQLKQVFLNILINARDAVDANDKKNKIIVLEVKPAANYKAKFSPPVEKEDINPDDFFCVKIEDNGIGMDKDTLIRIYDPFFTTKPIGKGTGMGLAMAYGAITNHHGWIQVESEEQKGTAFYVFLPQHEEKEGFPGTQGTR